MFKESLLELLRRIERSEREHRDVMVRSVEEKLDRSFRNYEKELEETCRYILSKNPVTVIKEMNKLTKLNKKKKEKKEANNESKPNTDQSDVQNDI